MGLELKGSVSLDGSGWEAGLNKIEHATNHIKNVIASAFGVAAIEEAIRRTVEYGSKITDTSRRVGVSIEALQELGFAAKQSGSDLEALTNFIERLNSARINPKKFASFEKLGLDSVARNLPVEELIMKLSLNLRNRSSQEVIGPLRDIGGRGAGSLLPMLKENLDEVREAAHKLGDVMKTQDAVMLKFLADEMQILSQVILVSVAPAIISFIDVLMLLVNRVKGAGTFWGKFGAKPDLGKEIVESFAGSVERVFGPGSKKGDEAINKLNKRFIEAGAASETEVKELDEATAKMKEDLIKRQKAIEGINAIPDFESVMDEPKTKKIRAPATPEDSLIRVGNFLGNSQSAITRIGERTNVLLEAANSELRAMRQILAVMGTGSFEVPP